MMIPYRFNYPLLLGSWQGQALVSLNKLAKAEGLQILDGVGLLETFYARGYLPDLRTSFRQLITHVHIDQRLLDRRLIRWTSSVRKMALQAFRRWHQPAS
jgi:hypothetical protein